MFKQPLRKWLALMAACVSMLLTGCGTTLLPESQLAAQGADQFAQMQQEIPLSQNQAHINQVQRVGQAIATAAAEDIPDAAWEFVVFDDPSANAFALPGGKVGVFTGLLDLVETDDELAVVMGHEVAHVGLRHGNQRASAEILRQLGALATDHLAREHGVDQQVAGAVYEYGTTLGFMLPYSRTHEREADALGLYYMAQAGYDPEAAISFWEKMAANSQGQPPQFLSTHPSHEDRIERLRALIPEVRAAAAQASAPTAPAPANP